MKVLLSNALNLEVLYLNVPHSSVLPNAHSLPKISPACIFLSLTNFSLSLTFSILLHFLSPLLISLKFLCNIPPLLTFSKKYHATCHSHISLCLSKTFHSPRTSRSKIFYIPVCETNTRMEIKCANHRICNMYSWKFLILAPFNCLHLEASRSCVRSRCLVLKGEYKSK